MNPILKRLLNVMGCIVAIIYLPYLFGKMYNALIYSKLGPEYATRNGPENWICGTFTTLIIVMLVYGIWRVYCYIVYGD